ncbi:MFS general substrate transporter [Hyaloscypha variabilis F]|uniref:MFS general substrate transporter n=1 Tax=Hyaloscypha variabilis (strain UAMH 11265 / GT02V1 / F) TaxID=1149755 RepID=A0A2J6REL4_HYAVF|nr:MFS general substrate transporter [Hyaloscypha variabilis F]
MTSRATFYLFRFLLGVLEGGFIPDVILYLGYFYKNRELPARLAWFWTAYALTNIASAFLAYGILHLDGHHKLGPFHGQGWRYLFAIEGGITGLVGVLACLLSTSKGSKTPPANYLTLTLRALGFSTFNTNLLVIPSSVLFILQLQFWTWASEKLNQRFLVGLMSQVWAIPLLIALETLPVKFAHSNWVRYAISSLIFEYPYVHAILVAITSRNAGTVRTRTVGSSLYNMAVQTSNIISTQIYQNKDKPLYYAGNQVLLGIAAYNVILFVGAKFYYTWKNNQRDKIWDSMTREEKLNYLATTKDKGNKRLDFRFAS